jgi:hypothetical protein
VLRTFGASTGWPGGEDCVGEERAVLWGEVRVVGVDVGC